MKITRQDSAFDDRIGLLHFEGDLGPDDCARTAQVFREAMEGGKTFILAIMQAVTSISDPFVGELMGCKSKLAEKGGNLALVGLGYDLRERLHHVGADRIFRFHPDTHTAYKHFQWEHAHVPQVMAVRLPSVLHAVPPARRLVAGVARQKGFSARDAFRIETIVDEIANNAIEHGDATQAAVDLELSVDGDKVDLQVVNKTMPDKARTLQALAGEGAPPPPAEGGRGRGLALVKLISDSIHVSVDASGTTVKITKTREDL